MLAVPLQSVRSLIANAERAGLGKRTGMPKQNLISAKSGV